MTLRKATGLWLHDGAAFRRVGAGGPPGPSPVAPNPPTNLDATPSTYSLLLTWDPPASTPTVIDYYQVSVAGSIVANPGGTSLNLTGLTPSTGHECAVRAMGENGVPSAWTPAEVFYTNTVTPPSSQVYWGYAGQSSNNTEYQRTRDVLGRPQVLRWYSDDSALTYPSGLSDYTNLPVWFSWKPVYATLMAGGYDAAMTAWISARSTSYPTWWSTWHEPDVKAMSTAQSKAMTEYVGNFIHAHGNPMVRSVLCVGGYPASAKDYIPDDLSTIDVYAADPYASGQSSANRLTYSGGRAVVRRYLTDVANAYLPATMRIGIGEVGNAVTNGTDAQRRDWYRGFHDEMAEDPRTEVVALFHRGGVRFYDPANPSNVTSPLSAAYWAGLMT